MSSSQYVSAVNQSGDSGVSSLQRSGLNISVGDTKSIVLALQALQQKIRTLEQDRDYHQDQYERALHAHEAYKLDVERQMEEERAAYRKREQELAELLRKALEEKKRLESNYGAQHDDLASFRKELESMIEAEKRNAQQREKELEAEVEKLRAVLKEERSRCSALAQSTERLTRERQEVDDINEQLRLAMDELLTQEESQRRRGAAPVHTAPHSRHQPPRPSGAASRPAPGRGRAPQRRLGAASGGVARPRSHSGGFARSRRFTYEDPTVNSLLRDVRLMPGEVSCHHDTSAVAAEVNPGVRGGLSSRHHSALAPPPPAAPGDRGGGGSRNASATARTRETPDFARVASAPAVAGVSPLPPPPARSAGAAGAIPEVETQLKAELEDLQSQYRETVARASSEDIPREVLSAALGKISALIDHKLEQLRLIRGAQKEMEAVTGGQKTPQSREYYGDSQNQPLSADELGKATQRSLLVNELRSLLADSAAR